MFENMSIADAIKKFYEDEENRNRELLPLPKKPKMVMPEIRVKTVEDAKRAVEETEKFSKECNEKMAEFEKEFARVSALNDAVRAKYPTDYYEVLNFIYESHGVTELPDKAQSLVISFIYEKTDGESLNYKSCVVEELMDIINACK